MLASGYTASGGSVARLGVLGPTRMDYSNNMVAVRAVARYLTRLLGEDLDRTHVADRPLRGARRPARRDAGRDQEGVPQARTRAAPRRQSERRRGRALQVGDARVRRAERSRSARALRPRAAGRASVRAAERAASASATSSRRSSGRRRVAPPGRGRARERGQDALLRIEVDLDEVVFGTKRDIEVDTAILCETCDGSCCAPGTSPVTCDICRGTGQIQRAVRSLLGNVMTSSPCGTCRGYGTVIPNPCTTCAGQGRVRAKRTVHVDVPAGVDTGMRLHLPGEGEAGPAGGANGDLYLEVKVKHHDDLQPQRRRPARDARGADDRRDPRHRSRPCPASTARSRSRSRPGPRAPTSSPSRSAASPASAAADAAS